MTNLYYTSGGQRAARVNDLFTRIASRYDLINDVQSFGLHRYWKRRVMAFAGVRPGSVALDICCGTGDLALGLRRRGAEVVGLDFNERMIEGARIKAQALGPTQWRMAGRRFAAPPEEIGPDESGPQTMGFVRGDAQALPFKDGLFDIITVGYGLRNLADWEVGVREMRRVAKPGGRLVILDFGKPDNRFWRTLYFAYLRLFVPCLGWAFCGDAGAYAYILESLKHYPAQHGVAAKMKELGFERVGIASLLGGVMTINHGEKG